ncbi:MAG TPA: CAP domain-containing protein [Ilumatobacteraceae bacterium]
MHARRTTSHTAERAISRTTARIWRLAGASIATILVAGVLGAAPQPVTAAAPPVPAFIPPDANWLTTVNYFRAMSGLPSVTEIPAWSTGAYNHSRYMSENTVITHDEVDGGPWWTPDGDIAGNSGNVAVSTNAAASARSHVELWMTGPFHAIGVLRHNLQQVGYGQYSNPSAAKWTSGATLDVVQGMNWSIPRPGTPTVFPGDGSTTSLSRFIAETPDPRSFCGWTGDAGLPVIAMLPEVPTNAVGSISGPSGPLEVCTLTSANTSGTAKQILAGDHAVVVMPRAPLQPGTYSVGVTTAHRQVSWSFTVDPAATGQLAPLPTTAIVGPTAQFQPLTPFRLIDTRNGDVGGRLAANSDVRIPIAGSGNVPADATAVSANFVMVNPSANGHLTVYPCGGPRPVVATLNYGAGRVVANQAIVGLDPSGDICVSSHSDGDLVIDVNGVFRDLAVEKATPTTPTRIMDTRIGQGGSGRLTVGATVELQVTGTAGVPADAPAVTMNLTSVDPMSGGFITAYPCGDRPFVSSLNTFPLQTRPNLVIVPLSPSGTVCLFSTVDTDIVVDVNGYFATTGSKRFAPLQPIRLLDTREGDPRINGNRGSTRLSAGQVLRIPMAGQRGIPGEARAISANIAITEATSAGFLTAYPCGDRPVAANVNFTPGENVANAAQLTLDADGAVCLWSSTNAHVIIDVNGAWV